MATNDVAGKRVYYVREFFVNILVIILSGLRTLRHKKVKKKLKTFF